MGNALSAEVASRLFLSGNDAVAHAVRDAGVRVAAAYPGTPSTEILEVVARFPGLYAEWSPNEKVALEVALGASMMGARAFSAMKHVGLNVASDALMTLTVTGVEGGLVIAVADDVGMSSSQNEQDSRFWGRFRQHDAGTCQTTNSPLPRRLPRPAPPAPTGTGRRPISPC